LSMSTSFTGTASLVNVVMQRFHSICSRIDTRHLDPQLVLETQLLLGDI